MEGPCVPDLSQGLIYMSHLETSKRLQSGDPTRVLTSERLRNWKTSAVPSESPGTPSELPLGSLSCLLMGNLSLLIFLWLTSCPKWTSTVTAVTTQEAYITATPLLSLVVTYTKHWPLKSGMLGRDNSVPKCSLLPQFPLPVILSSTSLGQF